MPSKVDKIQTTEQLATVWYKRDNLKNILRNVKNGGYNDIPTKALLEDIKVELVDVGMLIRTFKNMEKSAKNLSREKIVAFLENAIAVISEAMRKAEANLCVKGSSDEQKKVKAWLDQMYIADDYLAENGHEEW